MSKRIALMTWHHTENYGTAYQAYALKRLLEKTGSHVDLVEYRRLNTSPLKQVYLSTLLHGYCKEILEKKNEPVKLYAFSPITFNDFWGRYFSYTQKCVYNQDFNELNTLYDGFVCGSDQIWGPEWFDARFFLDYVEDERRLIAYAPSIGVPEITNEITSKEMARLMVRFPYLSVREETGCRIASQLTGRNDVLNVLDPVLALETSEWNCIKEPVENLPPKFMFIFFLKNNEDNIKTSIKAAEEKGCKPVVLHCTQSVDTPFANIDDLTPGQLLTYIQNADYICTDSFHITVLSVIYQKDFKVFKKDSAKSKTSKNSRITDLLGRLGILGAEYDDDRSFDNRIDYNSVNETLTGLRRTSFEYLNNAICNLPEEKHLKVRTFDCEEEAQKKNFCNGECTREFKEYGNNKKGISKRLYSEMNKFPFSLQEKCYRCKYYNDQIKMRDNRKPKFWKLLNKDMEENKSAFYIFRKYYLAYYVSNLLKG